MNYVGVDLHKERSWFYVMDENGKKMSSKSISNELKALKEYFQGIPRPFKLAVEATYNWYFFVDQEYSDRVYLANSYELSAPSVRTCNLAVIVLPRLDRGIAGQSSAYLSCHCSA